MRVPISWLKDYVDLTVPVEEIAYRLTLAGLEVDTIEYIGIPAGEMPRDKAIKTAGDHLAWDREKIVVGHILEVKPHPDADRLVLAMVESGIGEVETCVTGAPNLYPYKGKGPLDTPLVTAYAREGAEVIDGHGDGVKRMVLKPKELRGIMNRTMVCSEMELGISETHEGILIFETDAVPGTPLQDVLGDAVLELELTPNMARNFSILGVAREIAALTGQEVRLPGQHIEMTGAPIKGQAAIEIHEPDLNPRFTLGLIRNVEIKPSPWIVRHRLKLMGMRPISNMVDVTNYVMLETGQPLHAFDYDVLVKRAGGKAPTIITRLPEPGERLTTLDDVDRQLDEMTILVCDTEGVLSLGGIMGGAESEVSDVTTNVLLEAANWNFINIRQTLSAQREHGDEIRSEAGIRFSRGVHPAQAEVGLRRATEMMRVLGGGEVAEGIIDEYPNPADVVTMPLPMAEVHRILGVDLPIDEVERILRGLSFDVARADDETLRVTVPGFRTDIGYLNFAHDEDIRDVVGQADLIEEIARIYGYDRIPNTLLVDELPPQRNNIELDREESIRNLLTRAGMQEVINYRMTTPELEARLVPPGAKSDWYEGEYVTMANPISAERTVMRHTLMNAMLEVLALNGRVHTRLALFEIGHVYLPVDDEQLPHEPAHLCLAMAGERDTHNWQMGAHATLEVMDFYDLKGVVEELLEALKIDDVSYRTSTHSSCYPGRAADLYVGKTLIGTMGQLHPLVAEAYELPDLPVLIAELELDLLIEVAGDGHHTRSISPYPAVYQDIALVVDEAVPAAEIAATIRQAGGDLLAGLRLFDVYRGEQLGEGRKSLAYSLTFQSMTKTLRDKDADKTRNKIVKSLEKKHGAVLRG